MARFASFFLPLLGMSFSPVVAVLPQETLASFQILTANEQQEAIEFILNKTEIAGYGATDIDVPNVLASMRNSTTHPVSHFAFAFRLNRMLSELLGDAHTRVEVTAEENYLRLDICLAWLSGEEPSLISTCQTDHSEIGT